MSHIYDASAPLTDESVLTLSDLRMILAAYEASDDWDGWRVAAADSVATFIDAYIARVRLNLSR